MRTVTNYFIVNLSLADVLVTITCLPATLVVDITETWFFGQSLCKVIPYLQVILYWAVLEIILHVFSYSHDFLVKELMN